MKKALNILAVLALFFGAFHLNSCAAFTKADAVRIGSGLAFASLNLASRVIDGEKLDLKIEAARLGLDVASQATAAINANLSAAVVVTASERAAKEVIQSSTTESPKVSALAESIASQAAGAALTNVQGAKAGH